MVSLLEQGLCKRHGFTTGAEGTCKRPVTRLGFGDLGEVLAYHLDDDVEGAQYAAFPASGSVAPSAG